MNARHRLVPIASAALVLAACATGGTEPAADPAGSAPAQALQDCAKDGQGFTGGATVPRQIFGSYGPGTSQEWDVESGTTTGTPQNITMATGMPNGTVTILWGEGADAGSHVLTVECTTAWDTYSDDDLTTLWHAGIIFNEIPGLGSNTYFCHRIEMDVDGDDVTMKMWENYWEYGEDYACPETLDDALAGTIDSPSAIEYLELPATGIGAEPVPPSGWTSDGTEVGVQP